MPQYRFIHSSDLHLGRRFGTLPEDLRGRLVEARHAAIARLAEAARAHGARDVLLAGDVFDSQTPSAPVRRQALAQMGAADDLVWWLLPGNHDSLAAEQLWEALAAEAPANLRPLTGAAPVVPAPGVALLPAPPPSRFPGRDVTAGMEAAQTPEGALRIGLAHGGVVDFAEAGAAGEAAATIPPDRAARAGLDYLALGDWHGARAIGPRTHYSGTPERDGFRHAGRGVCLAVTLPGPGAPPAVTEVETGRFDWREPVLELGAGDDPIAALSALLPPAGAGRRDHLLRVCARGWVRPGQARALEEVVTELAPDFALLELDDTALQTEYRPADLDEIASSGALRMAAEALLAEARDADAEDTRATAAAALARLHGLVRGAGA